MTKTVWLRGAALRGPLLEMRIGGGTELCGAW